ncbi:MAG TPA: IclR family transcriptional regulator [Sphingomonadaceae bacterium]|nr:IclR family transcriptional regulator [Sphingomonadaceae bacterium]
MAGGGRSGVSGEGDAVKSAARALDVLEYVARMETPPTFAGLASSLRIPKSSLSNLLATLVDRHYLIHEGARGGYRAGPGIERLTHAFWRSTTLVDRIETVLADLRDELGETAGYSERRGDEVEVIATQPGKRPLVYMLRVGARTPMHRVSTGKILLATLEDSEIDAYADRTDFSVRTRFGISTREELHRDIAEIRATGIARSRGEVIEDVVGMATALRLNGEVMGAICVALPASRYDERLDADIATALRAAALRFDSWLTKDRIEI